MAMRKQAKTILLSDGVAVPQVLVDGVLAAMNEAKRTREDYRMILGAFRRCISPDFTPKGTWFVGLLRRHHLLGADGRLKPELCQIVRCCLSGRDERLKIASPFAKDHNIT